MEFVWDEDKAEANKAKHGVLFAEAVNAALRSLVQAGTAPETVAPQP